MGCCESPFFGWDCKSQVAKTRSMDFSGGPVADLCQCMAKTTTIL